MIYKTILDILTLIGALGLFLYGMKVMSEALQKVAGSRLRTFLANITANRYRSIFTGFTITALIQSSSATTVMIVSFVNAGLLSLFESIGLIMGANIGTTITAWLISLIGFNFKIYSLALPLIGLGFPLLFSRINRRKNLGEFIIGLAVIFVGLEFIKNTVPDISTQPEALQFLASFTDLGVLSILLFMLAGAGLTIFIQSSSAAMALTLVMCYRGWINFELAAAMILGENIGTTITAVVAALVANKTAKRSALSHLVFNLLGMIWVIPLLRPILAGIETALLSSGINSPFDDVNAIPVALSVFHSFFNLLNTVILVGFITQIERLVTWMIPPTKKQKELFRLKHFASGIFSTSEISILQARKEIALYGKRTHKMFRTVRSLFEETNEDSYLRLLNKIHNYEEISDRMEIEIATYLTKLSEGELSQEGTRRIRAMLKLIDDIESIGDVCENIASVINRKKEEQIWFPQELRDNLKIMFDLIERAFEEMNRNLETNDKSVSLDEAQQIEKEINELQNTLRQQHLRKVGSKEYKYQSGVIYTDILSHSARLGDFIFGISETLISSSRPDSTSKPE